MRQLDLNFWRSKERARLWLWEEVMDRPVMDTVSCLGVQRENQGNSGWIRLNELQLVMARGRKACLTRGLVEVARGQKPGDVRHSFWERIY